MSTGRTITLEQNDDGWWTAIDEQSGAVSQGDTRAAALENLDEAIGLVEDVEANDDSASVPNAPWFDE